VTNDGDSIQKEVVSVSTEDAMLASLDGVNVSLSDVAVLLVDDDESWVTVTGRLLERERELFSVTTATDLSGAREAYEELDPDCVVCDYQLGGGTGFDLLASVRERNRNRPFVLITSKGNEVVASTAISRGVTDYVRKSAFADDVGLLARRIETAVRSYRAERALVRERRSKQELLDIVTETTSREELARQVCRHLVAEHGYKCAWIGTYTPAEGVVPLAGVGCDGYLDATLRPASALGESTEPSLVALSRREPYSVTSLAADTDRSDVAEDGWQPAAVDRGFRRAVAVPVQSDGSLEGVLAVYGTDDSETDPRERTLLADYGETVGYAFKTANWKQTLLSATPTAVEIRVPDERVPLVALARCLSEEATVDVRSAVSLGQDTLLYVAFVDGVSPETLADAASRVTAIRSVDVVGEDRPLQCEIETTLPTPESVLVEHGAQFEGATVDGDGATVSLVAPGREAIRRLAAGLRAVYADATVDKIRPTEHTDRAIDADDVLDRLTDRQREALELAFYEGYFEQPREHNATEVAERMSIERTTFSQHLRTAEQKIFDQLLNRSR
jgi:predicted DNA binding protein/CheY-like chemotaxis protein